MITFLSKSKHDGMCLLQQALMEKELYLSQTKILEGLTKGEIRIFEELYAPQTKILEGRTNISECVENALFKG